MVNQWPQFPDTLSMAEPGSLGHSSSPHPGCVPRVLPPPSLRWAPRPAPGPWQPPRAAPVGITPAIHGVFVRRPRGQADPERGTQRPQRASDLVPHRSRPWPPGLPLTAAAGPGAARSARHGNGTGHQQGQSRGPTGTARGPTGTAPGTNRDSPGTNRDRPGHQPGQPGHPPRSRRTPGPGGSSGPPARPLRCPGSGSAARACPGPR